MFITKQSLSRRTVLRGLGATLALPLLDAMVPALTPTVRTAGAPTRRFGAVFVPMGERPSHWNPTTTGVGFEFSPILKPLEPFRDSVTVVTDLDRPLAGTHAVSTGTWLTGAAPKRTEAEDFIANTSLDQVIANQIGRDSVFPSFEIATEDLTGYVGACDVGYSCAYMNTISWKSPTSPMPMETNPRVVFERMFGRPGSASERMTRLRQNRSILDSVKGDVSSLERGLGARDKVRLDQYLEHLREIEGRIQRAEKQTTTELIAPRAPVGIPDSWEEHATVMFDLMALAFEADLTRVFTFMLNREASQLVFPDLGFNEPWHHVSHHGNEPEKLALLVKLNTWQIELFGKFLKKPAVHARRRRQPARSLGAALGQRHERQQHALAARRAVPDGGQGRRRVHRQPSHRGAEGHAARQRHAHRRAEVRRRDRQVRRQHGRLCALS